MRFNYELVAMQQQLVEAKKSGRVNALKELRSLSKEFGFTIGTLKGSFAENGKMKGIKMKGVKAWLKRFPLIV